MDNTSFHLCWEPIQSTQSIYIYTNKIGIIKQHTLAVILAMEWTQNYK